RTYYGSLGGPIWIPKLYKGTNRTFFWLALEGYRDTQGNSGQTSVPTLRERQGDFSQTFRDAAHTSQLIIFDPTKARDANGNRVPFTGNVIPTAQLDKVGYNIAQTFAAPTSQARFYGDNNISYSGVLPSKAGQGDVKLDHRIADWWNVNLSFLRYHSNEPGENWFPNLPSTPEQWVLDRIVDATQINTVLTVNPTTVLALRYGFNRFPNDSYTRSKGFNLASLGFSPTLVSSVPRPQFPGVQFQNFYNGSDHPMGAPGNNAYYVPYSRNFVGSVAKYMGRHSMKVGADWRSISDDGIDFDGSNASTFFAFDDVFTRQNATRPGGGADLASMLLGYPSRATGFRGSKLFENVVYTSAFFQDDIRINSKLTINAGLRWEHETGLKER